MPSSLGTLGRPAVTLALLLAIVGASCGGAPTGTRAPGSVASNAASGASASGELASPRPAASLPPAPTSPASSRVPVERIDRAPYVARLVPDGCVDRDLLSPPTADPVLRVLDRTYALAADDVPPDLVPVSAAGFAGTSSATRVRQVVVADLTAMRASWESAGLRIVIASAYRSYQQQASTYQMWLSRLGTVAGPLHAARPGHSEHQLGTTLDLDATGTPSATHGAEAWLADHAWEYGFVLSYPEGATAATCYTYEPWHYRWIGRPAAAAVHASGLTLREWLEPSWGFSTGGR